MSLRTRGMTALIRRQQAAAVSGNTITYTRGAQTLDLTDIAWAGRTVFSSNLEGAARIEFGDRDYFVPVAELVFGGEEVEPRIGDRITEEIDGTDAVFEVLVPNTGEPAWRYSDTGQTLWRIHCKRVK